MGEGQERAHHAQGRGHLLSSTGRYQDLFRRLENKYPNIQHADYKRPNESSLPPGYRASDRKGRGRVSVLEFLPNHPPRRLDFTRSIALEEYFNNSYNKPNHNHGPTRRLFILETLDPDLIAVLGHHLRVDPRVFSGHDKTGFWERLHNNGNHGPLPSLKKTARWFNWDFWDLRTFERPLNYDYRVANGRHIALFRLDKGLENVGRVHQKASYWSIKRANYAWDGRPNRRYEIASIRNEPYQGGYADFIDYEDSEEACQTPGPGRKSLLEDLCYYWTNHYSLMPVGDDPLVTTVFLQKIIASHYMLLLDFLSARHYHIEWQLTRQTDLSHFNLQRVEQNWSELQAFNRRYINYITDLETIMTNLNITETNAARTTSWISTDIDFLNIYKRMRHLELKCNAIVASYSSLASLVASHQSMADTKRSISEAKSVKALTWLATTFIPLSFVGALFSMNERYLPGTSSFWIYFAVALPLVFVTLVTVLLFGRGYDEENTWSLRTWTKSWRLLEDYEGR